MSADDPSPASPPPGAVPRGSRIAQYVGVGCLTTVAGLFGGGMIAVLIARLVSGLRGCRPPEGLPACDHLYYWVPGMILGAILLPTMTIRALRRSNAEAEHSARG